MFENAPSRPASRKVYGISELVRKIKAVLESDIGNVWVEGEISGFKQAASGHMYFDLKDETALINCCLFRGSQRGLRVVPANGLKVRVNGQVTNYPQRSSYQIIVSTVEELGRGDLQRAFEELKAKLAAEGLFKPEHKKSLPALPQTIGIVTSPTGAVIRDMLHVLERRFPDRHILLAPARVQGAGAAEEIAAALDLLNAVGGVDVIIVGRGGGSLEDLWAFNEEVVARAVFRSAIPVISAVGHETDFTICDFVADVRAPTPSAAAEIVIRPKQDLEEQIAALRRRLAQSLHARALVLRNRFIRAARSYVFHEPEHLLKRHRERTSRLLDTMRSALASALTERQQRFDEAVLRLGHSVTLRAQKTRHRVERSTETLRALNPHAVLARGYSVTLGPDGHALQDPDAIDLGAELRTLMANGTLTSTVTAKERRTHHERD